MKVECTTFSLCHKEGYTTFYHAVPLICLNYILRESHIPLSSNIKHYGNFENYTDRTHLIHDDLNMAFTMAYLLGCQRYSDYVILGFEVMSAEIGDHGFPNIITRDIHNEGNDKWENCYYSKKPINLDMHYLHEECYYINRKNFASNGGTFKDGATSLYEERGSLIMGLEEAERKSKGVINWALKSDVWNNYKYESKRIIEMAIEQ